MSLAGNIGFVLLLSMAAISDLRSLRIPNWITLALVGLFCLRLVFGGWDDLWLDLAVSVAILAVGFGLFATRLFGAGDAKLFAGSSLWLGAKSLGSFALLTALGGLLLAVLYLAVDLWRRWLVERQPLAAAWAATWSEGRRRRLPYGVAIALGGIAAGLAKLPG